MRYSVHSLFLPSSLSLSVRPFARWRTCKALITSTRRSLPPSRVSRWCWFRQSPRSVSFSLYGYPSAEETDKLAGHFTFFCFSVPYQFKLAPNQGCQPYFKPAKILLVRFQRGHSIASTVLHPASHSSCSPSCIPYSFGRERGNNGESFIR